MTFTNSRHRILSHRVSEIISNKIIENECKSCDLLSFISIIYCCKLFSYSIPILVVVGDRIHDPVRVADQPRRVPSPHAAVARHWDLLHGVVLRVRSYQHKGIERSVQGAVVVFSSCLVFRFWNLIPALMGRNLCLM